MNFIEATTTKILCRASQQKPWTVFSNGNVALFRHGWGNTTRMITLFSYTPSSHSHEYICFELKTMMEEKQRRERLRCSQLLNYSRETFRYETENFSLFQLIESYFGVESIRLAIISSSSTKITISGKKYLFSMKNSWPAQIIYIYQSQLPKPSRIQITSAIVCNSVIRLNEFIIFIFKISHLTIRSD